MNHIKLYICLIATSFLFLTGCEDYFSQEADSSQLDEGVGKLVVFGYISPQNEQIVVNVSKSESVYRTVYFEDNFWKDELPDVADAEVTLSDGENSVKLAYTLTSKGDKDRDWPTQDQYNYVISAEEMPVIPGKTYTLTVATPDGEKVTASCRVPAKTPELSMETFTYRIPESKCYKEICTPEGRTTYGLRVKWNEIAGEENYYRLAGKKVISFAAEADTIPDDRYIWWEQEFVNNSLSSKGEFIQETNLNQFLYDEFLFKNDQYFEPKIKLHASLLTVDEHYYTFHTSYENSWSGGGDNPFAEPTPIYSNIEGGFGVFGAYVEQKVVLDLPIKNIEELR